MTKNCTLVILTPSRLYTRISYASSWPYMLAIPTQTHMSPSVFQDLHIYRYNKIKSIIVYGKQHSVLYFIYIKRILTYLLAAGIYILPPHSTLVEITLRPKLLEHTHIIVLSISLCITQLCFRIIILFTIKCITDMDLNTVYLL